MEAITILFGTLSLGVLGFFLGRGLLYAHQKLSLPVDEAVKKIEDVLPGMNCGACAYAGCALYAQAIVHKNAPISLCIPGGQNTTEAIANIMGSLASFTKPKVAFVRCQGNTQKATINYEYHGILECAQAIPYFQGAKHCEHSCLGLGTCFRACPFGAIQMCSDMLVKILPEKCTGCGLCVKACPRDVIQLVPYQEEAPIYQVACLSTETALNTRKECRVGCIGCGLCVKKCPVTAITMQDNLAIIDYDLCIGCGDCAVVCPVKAILPLQKKKSFLSSKEE